MAAVGAAERIGGREVAGARRYGRVAARAGEGAAGEVPLRRLAVLVLASEVADAANRVGAVDAALEGHASESTIPA